MKTPLTPGHGTKHAPQPAPGVNVLGFPPAGTMAVRATPTVSVHELWRIAVKHRAIILAGLALGVALGIIVSMLTQPRYRSTAVLEISQDSVQMIDLGNQKPIPVTDRQFLETQYGLLKSRSLAERVARELKLSEDPEFADPAAAPTARLDQATKMLGRDFMVEPVDDSQLIRINFDSINPQLAADVTNSFAANFIASVLERRYEANDYARNFLERRIAEVRGRLEDSERRLVGYAQNETIVSVGGAGGEASLEDRANQSLAAASLSAANGELAIAQNARVAAEQRFVQASRGAATNEVLQSPPLQAMKSRLAELRSTYEQKRNLMKPDHPEMLEIQAGMTSLDSDISRERSTIISALGAEFRAAAARESELRRRVSGLTSSVLDLRGRMIQYNILQRDVDTNRQLYDALLQRFKEVGVSGGVGENQISVVDPAKRPPAPFEPDFPRNILIGAVVGLLGGIGSALGLGILLNKVRSLEDIGERLGITPLGVIPLERGSQVEDALDNPRSSLSEAYASLRSEIQFAAAGSEMNSMLVTSAGPSEGKSTTALALAQNFARLGKATLLIDADMRHPSFETERATVGLSGLLTGRATIEHSVIATSTQNLSLLPAGKVPPNPVDLLADSRLPKLIRELEGLFDIVIIDGPPVLGLADAPLLAVASDRTLLVLETDRVGISAARSAIERLRAANAHIVGGILTKFVAGMAGYGYGYGYGYGIDHEAGGGGSKIRLAVEDSAVAQQGPRDDVAQQDVSPVRRGIYLANRIARVLLWTSLVLVFALATFPAQILPDVFTDKTQHVATFAVLTALALWAYPKLGLVKVAAGMIAFGAVIEFVQMLPAVGREGDLGDFLADVAAVASVVALALLVRTIRGVYHPRAW